MGAVALIILAGLAASGADLRRLADLRLRSMALLPLALGLQVLVITVAPGAPRPLAIGTHLGTYVLAAVFVWRNRAVAGLPLLALGAASNAVTIFVNGGTLPASAAALRSAGLDPEPGGFTNSGTRSDPLLPWLGDVFAVPAGLPFANVFSIGDVVVLVGFGVIASRACRPTGDPGETPGATAGPPAPADRPVGSRRA